MCQTEAIGRDLSLMTRLSEETGSLPLCKCRISPVLMSLQTPGTTYHPLTESSCLHLLLSVLLYLFFLPLHIPCFSCLIFTPFMWFLFSHFLCFLFLQQSGLSFAKRNDVDNKFGCPSSISKATLNLILHLLHIFSLYDNIFLDLNYLFSFLKIC